MFDIRDLFQWERFVTPAIIRVFYGVGSVLIVVAGVAGVASSLQIMTYSFVGGIIMALLSLLAAFAAVLALRIACEYVLVMFRMNEHLGALRNRAEM